MYDGDIVCLLPLNRAYSVLSIHTLAFVCAYLRRTLAFVYVRVTERTRAFVYVRVTERTLAFVYVRVTERTLAIVYVRVTERTRAFV